MEENEAGGENYTSNPYALQNNSFISSIIQKQVEGFSSPPATSSLFNLQNNRRVSISSFILVFRRKLILQITQK